MQITRKHRRGNIIAMSAIAAIAAFPMMAVADWSSAAYTNTQDGVSWQFKIDTANNRAMLGTGTTSGSDTDVYWGTTSKASLTGAVDIPASFIVNGDVYTLSSIGNRSFIRYQMSSLTVPISIPGSFFRVYDYAFYECTNLESIWFSGPSSGDAPSLMAYSSAFGKGTAIKFVLISPNVKKHNDYDLKLSGSTGATIIAPLNPGNTTWSGNVIGGTDNSMLFYSECDEATKTITFAPTNVATLAAALDAVVPLKGKFGFDTVISITNRIDEATAIPAEAVPYVSFDLHSWVAFKATTQAQLANILAAVSADSPIIIDPTGATETLTVPEGRSVFVRLDGGDTIRSKIKGIIIGIH